MKTTNRTFIVSGGSSGLGLATVQDLVQSSPTTFVAILDRNEPPAPNSFPNGENTRFFKTDITNVDDIQTAVNNVISWATTGTHAPIAGLINCAGVSAAAKIIDSKNEPHALDVWNFVMEVNVTGTFNLTRLVLRHMVTTLGPDSDNDPDQERGVVIFVSSSAAFEGQPGQAAYAASKGAIASMTLPIARDLARHNIRVMSIAPGAFESSMTKLMPEKTRRALTRDGVVYPRRFGEPSEFAKACRFIIETPYMNGEVLRLSGGGRLPARL